MYSPFSVDVVGSRWKVSRKLVDRFRDHKTTPYVSYPLIIDMTHDKRKFLASLWIVRHSFSCKEQMIRMDSPTNCHLSIDRNCTCCVHNEGLYPISIGRLRRKWLSNTFACQHISEHQIVFGSSRFHNAPIKIQKWLAIPVIRQPAQRFSLP